MSGGKKAIANGKEKAKGKAKAKEKVKEKKKKKKEGLCQNWQDNTSKI